MFETSVVHAQAAAARGRFGLLPISLIAHSAVIIGAVAVSVASVNFPGNAPDEITTIYEAMPVPSPPPLGRPDGGAAPAQPKPSTPPPARQPNEVTAPAEIPDEVPTLAATTPGDSMAASNATGTGTSTEPLGVPWGTKDSIGDLDAPPAVVATPAIEDKVYRIEGDVKAPVLIHRVEPAYPEIMRRSRLTATVMIECVIDKNGRVRNARVISGNSMPPFTDAVVRALEQWRYKPGSLHGEAVETLLHVTVKFGIN